MTDPGGVPVTPQDTEYIKKLMFEFFQQHRCSKTNCSHAGGASSSNLGNEPEKDKKTPKKAKKQPNKKLEALKKKVAEEKAKHLKTVKQLRELKLLAKIERKEKLVEKRKSLVQKDEEKLQALKGKINQNTDQ